jgi:hypothetical protein
MLADPSDLLLRYDRRLVAQLARDDGREEESPESSERVITALQGAEGQLRAAVLKGRRYSVEELEQLAGPDREFLKDVVCALAMVRLAACRVNTLGGQIYETLRTQTTEILKALESGELIFVTPSAQAGSLPRTEAPMLADMYRLNLLVDRCSRYYPSRADADVG